MPTMENGYHLKKSKRFPPRLSYEAFMWTWYIILMVLACIDRFEWNVWPRQTYSIGAGSAGSDKLDGLKEGPWSVQLYDALARVSGRFCIIAYDLLLLTRFESVEYYLTTSFVGKYLLDCTDIVNANLRLHKWNGIGLVVLTILHVWSILFPCVTHGWSAVVVSGTFEWPLSERKPIKCSKCDDCDGCWPGDVNVELEQMGLQVDDVFRIVEMTIFLGILMPLSIRWLSTRWHAAIQLHRWINIVYFVDIVRRHTHPHSWILNTPFFFYYVFDKWVWANYFHRNKSPWVDKRKIGEDFMVLYWKSPFGTTRGQVGPDYAMCLNNSSFLEDKHTFTCFENRCRALVLGTATETASSSNDDSMMERSGTCDKSWDVGVVIRVFRNKRNPQLGKLDPVSHTQRMYEAEDVQMLITGPRQGEMSALVHTALTTSSAKKPTLIGAGSAINFILDALQWCNLTCQAPEPSAGVRKIVIFYTTRDLDLLEWSTSMVADLLMSISRHQEDVGMKRFELDVTFAFTGKHAEKSMTDNGGKMDIPVKRSLESLLEEAPAVGELLKMVHERANFHEVIPRGGTVFCQGGAGLKNAVAVACKKNKAKFFGGRGGSA